MSSTYPRALRALSFLGIASVLLSATLPAQAALAARGRIVGRILDGSSGAGLTDVAVQVVGTGLGTLSGLDGRFSVNGVPAGTVTLQVRRIGFAAKTVTGILVNAGQTVEQNVSLAAATVQLQTTTITASKEKGTVAEALNMQRNATNVVNAITAEQMQKSPDGDAAQAVQRVSGVTVQDGKYVFVRGLGERYTTASLNGARLPSPEPERKVVPLDLFPTGLLQSVTTLKTFTPDLPGDFSGGQVDIRTREFPAKRQTTLSISSGGTDRVVGTALPSAPRAGGERLGFAGSARNIPSLLDQTNFLSGFPTQSTFNQITQQQRNVWTAGSQSGRPNVSAAASVGGSEILGQRIGYLMSGSYGLTGEVRANEENAIGNQGANNTVVPLTRLRGTTGRESVLWGGLANFSVMLGRSARLAWNNTLTRSADNEARVDRGFDENLGDSIARTTLRYVERGLVSTNMQAELQLNGRNRQEWSATYARTSRAEPDRSDVVTARSASGAYTLLSSLDGARRLYFDLQEENVVAQASHTLTLGDATRNNTIKAGGYFRQTARVADAPIFAFVTRAASSVTAQAPEVIFGADQACSTCSNINVQPVGQAGSYVAQDQTGAGFLMGEFSAGDRVRIITGARAEQAQIIVRATTQSGFRSRTSLDNLDVLPSLIVNTKLTETQSLRFAATRTLARPEYRELAPVTFRDVLGGVSITGNASLVRTTIDNLDLRWEWFPRSGEVISLGAFGKRFVNPIERVEQATSGAYQATFQNARSGENYGIEVELRKTLDALGAWAQGLSAFSNITVMDSRISLDTTRGLTVTNRQRRMVGQAPYVINSGLTYANVSGDLSATLLYNRVGPRIVAAGVLPLPDIIDQARNVLDLSLRFPLRSGVSARVDARNLLDARYRVTQGTLTREAWNVGRTFSVGLNWRP
jgi:outer membrane receptor for ferrienterochelin and colicin